MMQALSQACPIRGMPHLKRVRTCQQTSGETRLEVLLTQIKDPVNCDESPVLDVLCDTQRDPATINSLPEGIQNVLRPFGIQEIGTAQVPLFPAGDRNQFEEWKKIWPLNWIVPSTKSSSKESSLSESEEKEMVQWLKLALERSEIREKDGSESNVALMVNPQSGINAGKEITCGYDETQIHPIHHSVMQAVSQVSDLILQSSQRDLATVSSGLSKHPYIPQIPVSKAWNVESWHSLQCTSSDYKHWPIKRCYHRVETLKKFAKNYIQEEGTKQKSCEGSNNISTDDWQELECQGLVSSRQYLCTGYDCYVTQEPCTVCAMALVHSRVSRVIYCKSDTNHGALGGKYKLHSQKSLNHHYTVFRIPWEPG